MTYKEAVVPNAVYELEYWHERTQTWIRLKTCDFYEIAKMRQDIEEADDIKFKRGKHRYRILEVTKRVISSNLIEPTQRVITI